MMPCGEEDPIQKGMLLRICSILSTGGPHRMVLMRDSSIHKLPPMVGMASHPLPDDNQSSQGVFGFPSIIFVAYSTSLPVKRMLEAGWIWWAGKPMGTKAGIWAQVSRWLILICVIKMTTLSSLNQALFHRSQL